MPSRNSADRRRRGVEIGDRSELALAHHAEGGEHRREQHHEDHNQSGRQREYAAEILIVAKARLELGRQEVWHRTTGAAGQILHIGEHDAVHVVARRLGTEGRGTVEEEGDLGPAAGDEVAAEARRDVDHQAQVASAQTAIDLCLAVQGRHLSEIARGGEALDQLPAVGAMVAIEHGERQILHVEGDAVSKGKKQQQRTEQRKA